MFNSFIQANLNYCSLIWISSNMSTDDLCNVEKVFEKLDKTFLPKNYQRSVVEEFCSMKFKTGNKLSEFYEDLTFAYTKARPHAPNEIMEEDITSQFCKALPPEVYVKCLIIFIYRAKRLHPGMTN